MSCDHFYLDCCVSQTSAEWFNKASAEEAKTVRCVCVCVFIPPTPHCPPPHYPLPWLFTTLTCTHFHTTHSHTHRGTIARVLVFNITGRRNSRTDVFLRPLVVSECVCVCVRVGIAISSPCEVGLKMVCELRTHSERVYFEWLF